MSNLWYENPKILLSNYHIFFPNINLNYEEKINALARFAIYFSILIIIFNQNIMWLSLSIIILIISYSIGKNKIFENFKNKNCVRPTAENPFMNFVYDDYNKNVDREEACEYDEVKDAIKKNFNQHIVPDPADLFGTKISQRQFFTMPSTRVSNNQTEFAQWLYGDSGDCKTFGKNCDKNRDNRYNASRLQFQY